MRRHPLIALALATATAAVVTAAAGGAVRADPAARVTATTPTIVYIDAGTDDGLVVQATWPAVVGGRPLTLTVTAVASHSAAISVAGGPPPPRGTLVPLPPGLVPPAPVALRPPPAPAPVWRDDAAGPALIAVRAAANGDEPPRPAADDDDRTRISGEVALSALIAGDLASSSTSWQDLALASQLSIEHGAWRYDHLLEARISGSPEIFFAPLQHARARFDVYLLRIAYAPAAGRIAASIGRQPGAPLGELGGVDGGRARIAVDRRHGLDLTVFAGLRPASDLALANAPRAGVDLGWQLTTRGDLRARTDIGFAADAWRGALTRALAAASIDLAADTWYARADTTVDVATDAAGKSGARLTRASAYARRRKGAVSIAGQVSYDRPFVDTAVAEELAAVPYAAWGARTFAELDLDYALRGALSLGLAARASTGDDFTAVFLEAPARWSRPTSRLRATFAPHVIAGSLVDEVGARAALDLPLWGWNVELGASLDRVTAGGAQAWATLGRIAWSRSFLRRWRTSLAAEIAAGDGPARGFVFALLGYRLGR